MTAQQITRKLKAVDAGHRLLKHESKCRNLHGHRYTYELTVSAKRLDEVGRVVDFSVLERVVGGWLQEHWDHGLILQEGDPLAEHLRLNDPAMKVFLMPSPPSIEHLTACLFHKAVALLEDTPIQVERIRGYETPNCWADYTRMDASYAGEMR